MGEVLRVLGHFCKKKEAIEFLWEKILQKEILSNIQDINQGHKQY